jgi:hypothetical protein
VVYGANTNEYGGTGSNSAQSTLPAFAQTVGQLKRV